MVCDGLDSCPEEKVIENLSISISSSSPASLPSRPIQGQRHTCICNPLFAFASCINFHMAVDFGSECSHSLRGVDIVVAIMTGAWDSVSVCMSIVAIFF
jgi:hypothetical protein